MTANGDRRGSDHSTSDSPPVPRRRFRVLRLEERIAPKKGGKGTHNCGGSVGTSSGTLDCTAYCGSY